MRIQKDFNSIVQELRQFVRTNLLANHAEFDEHSLLAEAGIDSYSIVELLLFSERAFGVSVPESHLTRENLASLNTLAHCIVALAPASLSTCEASGS
jgi:acyl carrier protein